MAQVRASGRALIRQPPTGTRDKEFVARFDVPDGFDEHPPRILNRLTVGCACVVKPPRTVAAATAVNNVSVGKSEEKSMAVNTVTLMTTHRLSPGRGFTLVFEKALAACDPP